MNKLDRVTAPEIRSIDEVKIEKANTFFLSNGIAVHSINSGVQPVVGVEFIFEAGSWFEDKPCQSLITARMLAEGTLTKDATAIAEGFAAYGAFYSIQEGSDRVAIQVYTMSKHIEPVLQLVFELFTEANFPEKQLEIQKNKIIQSTLLNKHKTSYLSSVKFRELIFGDDHPYSYTPKPEHVSAITRSDLIEFYQKHFSATNCQIIIAGRFPENTIRVINTVFGKSYWNRPSKIVPEQIVSPSIKKHSAFVEKKGATQSSVRVGRLLFKRIHPDFIKLKILNELFGGYFGSRLMRNIREEKGLTYGIYSQIVTMRHAGYLAIGADVKKGMAQQVIDEIYHEMNKLVNEPIAVDELQKVRSYMLGTLVGGLGTPFDLVDKFKLIHFNGLGYAYFDNYIDTVKSISTNALSELARFYFSPSLMTEVISGDESEITSVTP